MSVKDMWGSVPLGSCKSHLFSECINFLRWMDRICHSNSACFLVALSSPALGFFKRSKRQGNHKGRPAS